jgi:hypothetical protein
LHEEKIVQRKLRAKKYKEGSTELSYAQGGALKKKLVCWKCNKEGHIKKDCPELVAEIGQSHCLTWAS